MTCSETRGTQAHRQGGGGDWGQHDAADDDDPNHSNHSNRCEFGMLLVKRKPY